MKYILILVGLSFGTFANAQKGNKEIKIILKNIVGRFNNQAQINSLPDSVYKKYMPNKPWSQLLFAKHIKVKMPLLGKNVVYICWRKDSINGTIERQRIWLFEPDINGNTIMRFFAFANDSIAKAIATKPKLLASLNKESLVSYSDSCTMLFTKSAIGYLGFLNPELCIITAQKSGRKMSLLAKLDVNYLGFNYNEAGLLPNGTKAFEVPGYSTYQFKKEDTK